MTDASAATETSPVQPTARPAARKRWFIILALVVLAGLAAWAIHAFFFAAASEETDDAYVAGDIVSITARDPGTVIALHADDTETVRRGQRLIDLDPATVDVQLAAAEADLARAVRGVRADFSSLDEGGASVAEASARLASARNDYARRRAAGGAVSGEEVAHAADAVTLARAALNVARSRLAQSRTATQGTSVNDNPAVLAAIAAVRRAAISQGHMRIVSPVDGQVARRTVQLGQQVAAGTPLMAVIPLNRLWVDANFRETQLRHLRVGQPVTVTADVYGDDVVFHGRVLGLSAGSGNAFALLPPQNASGNWIKIVQRVPVRIGLDPAELRAHPLRIGLSVNAEVDIADTSGTLVARPAASTFSMNAPEDTADVDARIRRIIAANAPAGR
ncbi:efflux RND transporter periplasmic adaptor subunit [Sphingomonas solaris]|uniref:HlyD family efflux transporter periplasmic adaptor subunit n=1 Tax=Alterirhizorhabdus solaris TaxID=2529389 RepID=A0A558QSK0_9SPHN|nr:HlyD family efflux transporter periplasmic adaptor subunit [Sphingomonas solaris]TVV70120.1 HlyD family efflux transporter periplasmic adaptor subunit [Sphingomonas solaris]